MQGEIRNLRAGCARGKNKARQLTGPAPGRLNRLPHQPKPANELRGWADHLIRISAKRASFQNAEGNESEGGFWIQLFSNDFNWLGREGTQPEIAWDKLPEKTDEIRQHRCDV